MCAFDQTKIPNIEGLSLDDDMDDLDVMLTEMASLAEEAGGWKDHISFDAALKFPEDPEVKAQFSGHVDECAYCQKLIDAVQRKDV